MATQKLELTWIGKENDFFVEPRVLILDEEKSYKKENLFSTFIKKQEIYSMKILIFDAGILGCNLAKNLFYSGKDVTLLARGN